MTKEEKLKHCKGCEDDYYNKINQPGTTQCWMLQGAKLIERKKVSFSQRPPWLQEAKPYFNCYRQKGYWFVKGDRTH